MNENYKCSLEELEELEYYAELEGTELGELCLHLLSIVNHEAYMLSDGFNEAVHQEIKAQLENFRNNAEVKQYTETINRDVVDLIWK